MTGSVSAAYTSSHSGSIYYKPVISRRDPTPQAEYLEWSKSNVPCKARIKEKVAFSVQNLEGLD